MRRLLAVLGKDVSASLSPVMHQAALDALKLDFAYVPICASDSASFERVVAALHTLNATGANVTIPYKTDARRLADNCSEAARAIGAVNTLSFLDGQIFGDNTDGPGMLALFEQAQSKDLLRCVQVLGAGGAARAVLWSLARAGAEEVFLCSRTPDVQLAAQFGAKPQTLSSVRHASLVISTLPPDRDLAQKTMDECIGQGPAVWDLAYRQDGGPTLARLAEERGLSALDGRALLVEQGALSLQAWTGADLTSIRTHMRRALGL